MLFAAVATTHPALGFLPAVVAAHVIAVIAGSMFLFMILLLLRGVISFVLGARAAERLATALQLATVVAMVDVFFYLPGVLPPLVAHMTAGDRWAMWLPPVWFAALYSWLTGTVRGVMWTETSIGLVALLTATLMAIPAYLCPAGLMARRALESRARHRPGVSAFLLRRLTPLLAAASPVRALSAFALVSLARNRRHLLVVVTYLGLGISMVMISIITGSRLHGAWSLTEPDATVLSLPLVMMFFVTFGVKGAFAIPTELDANWPFRLSTPSAVQAVAATRRALLLLAVLPVLTAFVLLITLAGWPPRTVAVLALFDLAAGLLLVECAIRHWYTIPFASAHQPDRETVKSRWLVSLVAVGIFAFAGAALQEAVLRSHAASLVYVGVLAGGATLMRLEQARRARTRTVQFDDDADDGIETLKLSEALR